MLTMCICSCHYINSTSAGEVVDYNDLIPKDLGILRLFENDLNDVIEKDVYSVFFSPYIKGKILLNNGEYFDNKISSSLRDAILGEVWHRVDFYAKGFSFEYKGHVYDVKFEQGYRYVFVEYQDTENVMYIENSRYPWVMYME